MLKTGEAPLRISRSFLNEAPRYYRTVKGGTSKMEYVVVGICIVAVVAIVALLTYNRGAASEFARR